MQVWSFIITLKGVTHDNALADRIYGSGCGDALLNSTGDIVQLDFDREAETRGEAIESALRDLDQAGIAAMVASIV